MLESDSISSKRLFSAPPSQQVLPAELLQLVITYAATSTDSDPFAPLDSTSLQPKARAKPSFNTLRGLSCVSHSIRAETLAAWFRILVVRNIGDWDMAVRMRICHHVL
jgi:hypothetical protein